MMHGIPVVNDYGPVWLKRYKRFGGFVNNGVPAVDFLNRPQLMSLISAQYLASKNPTYIDVLRATPAASGAPVTVLAPPSMTCAALACADARISGDADNSARPMGNCRSYIPVTQSLLLTTWFHSRRARWATWITRSLSICMRIRLDS